MRTLKFISLTMLILSMFIDALSQVNSVHIEANSTRGSNQVLIGASAGMFATSAADNVMLGGAAGYFTTGNRNTFLGFSAGYKTTSGVDNVFIGYRSGRENHGGNKNIYIGYYAGYANIWGNQNVAIGDQAGYSTTGSNNLFLGYHAGRSETGSNKLYIANSSTSTPLIYGEFDNNRLTVHGDLGIGTKTPSAQLHVVNGTGIRVQSSNAQLMLSDTHSSMVFRMDNSGNLQVTNVGTTLYHLDTDGRMGIGTTSPRNGLEIAKGDDSNYTTSLRIGGITPGNTGAGLNEETSRHQILFSGWRDAQTNTVGAKIVAINKAAYHAPNYHLVQFSDLAFYTLGSIPSGEDFTTERMRIKSDGKVGIGTDSPAYKLDVCGTIRAEEIKIDLNCSVPDFVFKKDYPLMDLKELEIFVQTNHHLPEIPSEKEMQENGVNITELQMKLLQKIEELTLYTIQQEEKIRVLEERMGKLTNAL